MDVIKFVYRKPIRDLAFHLEHNDLILTVSLDKTVKLVNMAIMTYSCDVPPVELRLECR